MKLSHSISDVIDLAERKSGIEGWRGYRWTAADGGGSIVRGCVPSGMYSRGPRKGLPKFRPAVPNTERTVVVTDDEMQAVAVEYERGGKCWHCKGTGKTLSRVHVTEGTTYRDCRRCGGTGLPPNAQVTGDSPAFMAKRPVD